MPFCDYMFGQSSIQERRRYYREEWSEKDIPDFIADGITKREFGFDHLGHAKKSWRMGKGRIHI